jgi:hypothetical protein
MASSAEFAAIAKWQYFTALPARLVVEKSPNRCGTNIH